MDANGTRFHLFFGRADWAKWSGVIRKPPDKEELHLLGDAWKSDELQHAVGLSWNEERGELTLDPRLFNFAPNGSAPSVENRRGAGRDRFGNWYWIDETSLRIRVLSTGSRTATDFWRLPEQCACPASSSSGDFQSLNEPTPVAPIKLSRARRHRESLPRRRNDRASRTANLRSLQRRRTAGDFMAQQS